MGTKYSGLQGLRFWAVSLVVASHCGFLSQGGVGNDIFFALSGFLASIPFKTDGEMEFLNIRKYGQYYSKRFFRIIPVYWASLLYLTFFLGKFLLWEFNSYDNLFLNMFFIKSRAHLWFLQQEMVFYILLPVLMTITALIKKTLQKNTNNTKVINIIICLLLILASCLSNRFLTRDVFYLDANSQKQVFRLGDFLCGMAFAYLYKGLKAGDFHFLKSRLFYLISDVYVFGYLLMTIVTAEPILSKINEKYTDFFIGWKMSTQLVYGAAIMIVLMLLTLDSLGNRFLGNPVFNYIGNISFIIYIIHAFLLSNFSGNVIQKLAAVYTVTFSLAVIFHVLVEKPVMKWYDNRKIFRFREYYRNLMQS